MDDRRWKDEARRLLAVNPQRGTHRVALRAGVSVVVPLLVLEAAGRPQEAIYAAFGAFTALYGRNHVHLSRLRLQSSLAVLLTVSVTLGVVVGTVPGRSWISVPVAALLAMIAAVWSDAQDWHPPGPLFVVFAFSACASIRSTPADVPVAAGVAAASALFSVAVGAVGWLRRPRPAGPPQRVAVGDLVRSGRVRTHVVRYGSAVTIAGGIATAAGIGHPYWAMVSAVVPMAAAAPGDQLLRGAHRILGTAIGLAVSAVLLSFHPYGLGILVLIALLQVGAEIFVGRNYGLALVFVTPLALLLGQIAGAQPIGALLFDRGVETVIGVLVALAVATATRRPLPGR